MRGIKFKVWDKLNKEWLDDDEFCIRDGKLYKITSIDNGMELDELDPEYFISVQYTGKKDKNDKEIYEGDLMTFPPTYHEYEGIFIIQWNPEKAWLSAIHAKDKGYNEVDYIYESPEPPEWKDGEIIGNIYENRELIELEKSKPNKKIN